MPERLYQFRFGDDFHPLKPDEVTPQDFKGLVFPNRLEEQSLVASPVRRFVREVRETISITSPVEAARYLLENIYTPFEQFDQEETWVLLLNTRNTITHEAMVYRGTVNSAVIRPVEIFKAAAQTNATAIVMSHNHPSGDPTPSPEDFAVTRSIVQAGQILGVELLDHIVVGKDRWVSLKERGLGFDWRLSL